MTKDFIRQQGRDPEQCHNPRQGASDETDLEALVRARIALPLSRRSALQLGLGAAAATLAGCSQQSPSSTSDDLLPAVKPSKGGFEPVAISRADAVIVPTGYRAEPLLSWGDPILPGAPAWLADRSQGFAEQVQQAGDNCDGMWFFPYPYGSKSSNEGLLVVNFEYARNSLHPGGRAHRPKTRAQVEKEMAAQGVGVVKLQRDAKGDWQVDRQSKLARRIHAQTPMAIAGPARGSSRMATPQDPKGVAAVGTFANCSMGYTPWGTYLTCEENIQQYFTNTVVGQNRERSLLRYGIDSPGNEWAKHFDRFNAGADSDWANEAHKFGWVVEIDPFDPNHKPIKRTALGRFRHESATVSTAPNGQVAVYMGDDARGEYVYKFVSAAKFNTEDRQANLGDPDADRAGLLDEGQLYVAKFNADGTGRWLPLTQGENGLTAEHGFVTQADVVIEARSAADLLGATTMDRPEWVAVDHSTKQVFFSLTNNVARQRDGLDEEGTDRTATNAANPRQNNLHGHIIQLEEAAADPTATAFEWQVLVLAGDSDQSKPNLQGTIEGDKFSSPDGLWVDYQGQLWVQTDYFASDVPGVGYYAFGNNQMLMRDAKSGRFKRFLVGPKGAEITGMTSTPDSKTFWVGIQHPTGEFPKEGEVARSTVMVITKTDGGVIGS